MLAGWLLTLSGTAHGADSPPTEPSLSRTEVVVTSRSENDRYVQRWLLMTFSTGASAWLRIERKEYEDGQLPEGYFVAMREGFISVRRYSVDSLEWIPGKLSPGHQIFGTKLQFRDLLLVQGGLNKPVADLMASSGLTIKTIDGEKGPKGISVRNPEGQERAYHYVRTRRKRGTVIVQKFRLSIPEENATVVVEYRNRKRVPATLEMFGREKDFLTYTFDKFEKLENSDD